MISVRAASPFDPAISRLIDELDAYQSKLYPPESNHLDSRDALAGPNSLLVAAYDESGVCGIGAVKIFVNYGEIKRVYVPAEKRGRGIAQLILKELEQFLLKSGIRCSRLETGIRQTEAIDFYRKAAYVEIPPFGDYKIDPLSLFMEKELL
jgi:putative acetyltransferase